MSSNRLGNIDALRAFAALAVFVQHGFMDVMARGEGGSFAGFAARTLETLDTGRLGVVIFFLISGFVVPYSIKPDRPLLRFAVSRLFRLYPAYWVSLVLVSVALTLSGQAPSPEQLLANGTMAATILGEDWMSGVYWTLFIEMLFYGAIIVLFVLGLLYRPLIVAGLGGLLALTSVAPILAPDLPLPVQYIGLHLSVLFSGLLLRLGLLEGKRMALVLAALLFVVQMGCVALAADYALQTERGFAAFSMMSTLLAYGLGFALFLAGATLVRADTRFMAHLAAISYSLYLLHSVVNQAVFEIMPLSGGWTDLAALAVSLALTIGLASLVYRWVEQPCMALGRHLLARPRAGLAAA